MTTTALTESARPRVDDYRLDWAARDANGARWNPEKHVDECFLCGRGITAKGQGRNVHMLTDGTFAPVDMAEEEIPESLDQGWFPVGPECAKRLPKGYVDKA